MVPAGRSAGRRKEDNMKRWTVAVLFLIALPTMAQRVRYFGPGVLTPLTDYVPYTGASQDVALGVHSASATSFKIASWTLDTHLSGETFRLSFGTNWMLTLDSGGNLELPGGATIGATGGNVPSISTGTDPPATTPGKPGDIFIDTAHKKLYFAVAATASTDWVIAN
jgi:hypothetical protein